MSGRIVIVLEANPNVEIRMSKEIQNSNVEMTNGGRRASRTRDLF
jgi:hypothetical protein